jgi:alkylation response protein AidB-like acyl-CoA dehydrogenase
VSSDQQIIESAHRLADELLFPAALEVDAADAVPRGHLDALAAAGLYGLSATTDAGGLDADEPTRGRVVEALAGGCLTTTFVWQQHEGVSRRASRWPTGARDRWAAALARGDVRAGVAIAGIRPGVEPLRARSDDTGWLLTGTAPWVTGWGMVHVVLVAALDDVDDVVWLVVDARPGDGLAVEHAPLAAVNASGTVTATFAEHRVPGDRLVQTTSYADWQAGDAAGLRGNGSLALGVAGRCARLLDSGAIGDEVDDVRARLDTADATGLPHARAAASELAWRAAAQVVLAHGARSVLRSQHAQRLAREAMFLLVFGSRRPIKTELQRLVAARPR